MRSDLFRAFIVVGCLIFFLEGFPGDLEAIVSALTAPDPAGDWRLALGLSIKTFLVLGSVVGLTLDKTFGYACLVGATAQVSLIRCGDFLAVVPAAGLQAVWIYWRQLWIPTLDLVFRAASVVFLVSRARRIIGEGVKK